MNEIIDSRTFSNFCGINDTDDVPDGDTIGRFSNILVENNLQERLFTQVLLMMGKKRFIFKKETIVDSTIIASSYSTKTRDKKRESKAHSVKKGSDWRFGYKTRVVVDRDTGSVNTIVATPANVHDVEIISQF